MTILVQTNVIGDGDGIYVYRLDFYDGSGSIKMVLTKDVASRILQWNLSELILLATQTKLILISTLKNISILKYLSN